MANKLSTITTQYHTYKVDQVLTHTQLNESIAFFEDQDRLTRVFLNGVGIVCGFNVSKPYTGTVRITQGIGVTTDGDMFKLLQETSDPEQPGLEMVTGALDYTYFREFEDLHGNYSKFTDADDNQLTLFEIIPEAKRTETDTPLTDYGNLDEWIVVLYLETFSKEADMCSGIDCDNQGVEQVARLRVLLTNEEGAQHLLSKDNIYQKLNAQKIYRELNKIKLKRVLLSSSNTQTLQKLENSYYDSITDTEIEKLADGLKTIADLFGADLQVDRLNFFKERPNIKFVNPFQYHYDWLRDVIATYHELIETLFALNATCLPDITAFPKHLLLGYIGNIDQSEQYRHSFYKSPITGDTSITANMQSLLTRLNITLSAFQTTGKTIQITPSQFSGKLSEMAIPFYYKPSGSLLDNWSFKKQQRRETAEIYQYDHKIQQQESIDLPALEYDLTGVDFYRIEGHQGKTADQALTNLNDMIHRYNLDFDVKILSINEVLENIRMEDYKCQFEDLMVLLDAWNQELSCIAGKISKYFTELNLAEVLAESEEEKKEVIPEKKTKDYRGLYQDDTITLETVMDMISRGKITYAQAIKYYPELFKEAKSRKTNSKEEYFKSVTENVATEEGKFGLVVDKVLKAQKDTPFTIDKFKVEAQKEAELFIGEIELSEEVRKAVVDKPIDIIGSTLDIGLKIPERLSELDENYLKGYGESIDRLCKELSAFKRGVKKLAIRDQVKSEFQSQAVFFSSICCADKKLAVLQKEIKARKENILAELQLHNFLKHHPGLDHRAGVTKGGTFVMVYFSNQSNNQVNAVEAIEGLTLTGRGEIEMRNKAALTSKIISDHKLFTGIGDFASDAALLEAKMKELETANFLTDFTKARAIDIRPYKRTLKDKTIIADFMLPYRCCSDCNPINFIVPRPVVSLVLRAETYCLGLEQEPVSFDVIPKDGTVSVAEEVPGVVISGQFISIDPETFPTEMLGKPIEFTVNDEPTDARLVVHEAPLFTIKLPEQPVINGLEVSFQASQTFDKASYDWDFGDGSSADIPAPKHTYDLGEEVKSVTISLTITPENGACPETVSEEIEISHIIIDDTIDLALEPNEFCRDRDRTPVPFDVVPEDARVEGTGVTTNQEGKFVFSPQMVPQSQLGKDIADFKVNGQEMDLIVRVYQSPHLLIDTKIAHLGPNEGNTVTFTVTNPPTAGKQYQWIIDGEEQETTEATTYSQTFKPEVKSMKVMVKAQLSNLCEEASSDEITVQLGDRNEGNCMDTGKATAEAMLRSHQEFMASPSFKEIGQWGQETMQEALRVMSQVVQNMDSMQSGEENEKLPTIFSDQLDKLVMYIIEMAPGNGPGVGPMQTLYSDYIRLFYLVLRCQSAEMLEASQEHVQQVMDTITKGYNTLAEAEITWDRDKTMLAFYEEVMPFFEKVEYIMDTINSQLEILNK
ncbi:PKD domain-containing protein [Echinicola vietnamensis]|uniref:PDK repeat-containing protein n=1 Tax=Echinicola vietnamensis (strain DSM 17526 / LMG 23754 / KMM 6221) TaxID=926556 RepID=L0G3B2_ECHVK|nr:PKD domain-containing protein [Echinicola vietnamensis]AGA79803.1 PDK repeat-containing protein [Echinicola vietnamensis DSM 17526]